MIKIAIVDDNELDASRLEKQLQTFFDAQNTVVKIDLYNRAINFLDTYQRNYDAILLDIDMPLMDGIEAAYKIRKISSSVAIIFETNYASLAIKGYGVNALGFIVKPVKQVDVDNVMSKLLLKLENEKDDSKISIKVKSGYQTIKVSEIKYIEVEIHNLYYHCKNGTFESRGVLKEIEASLNNPKFVKCSNCYLINLDYVDSIIKDDVKIDGKLLKISRNKKKAFVEAYLKSFN